MISDWNNGWRSDEDGNLAKLSNAEVRAARELRCTMSMTVRELACMYRVSPSSMGLILRGVTYRSAGGPLAAPDPRGNRARRATLKT